MTVYEPLLIKIIHLILLLILLFPHSNLAAVVLEDVEACKVRAKSVTNLQDKRELHEVYSGTNPVGNSIPQQKRMRRITKLHRFS